MYLGFTWLVNTGRIAVADVDSQKKTLQRNFVQDEVPNGPLFYTSETSDRAARRGQSIADLKGVKVTLRGLSASTTAVLPQLVS